MAKVPLAAVCLQSFGVAGDSPVNHAVGCFNGRTDAGIAQFPATPGDFAVPSELASKPKFCYRKISPIAIHFT